MRRRLLLFLPLALAGCEQGPTSPAELLRELPRPLAAAEQKVIASSNEFAFELLEEVAKQEGNANVLISPLSVSMALGMTLNGAAGATYEEIRETLGYGELSQQEINTAYGELIDLLLGLDPQVQLTLANSIWYRDTVPFNQSFFAAVEGPFRAEIEGMDFADSASVDRVNRWVDQATRGRIDSIIERIDPRDVMYLINALHFKGDWRSAFDPATTRDDQFTRSDGSRSTVRMMNVHGRFELGSFERFQAVDLPYGNGAFSMLVLVPRPGASVDEMLEGLDVQKIASIESALVQREMDVSIPRFTMEYDVSLNDALSALGMPLPFSGAADFTRLSSEGGLFISDVRHKTFVAVDEEGTEAAAVTKVGIQVVSAPPSFRADRPFVFLIRERLSGTILFAGRIEDPGYE